MTQAVQTSQRSCLEAIPPGQDEFYEHLAQVFIEGLKNARDALEQVASSLQGADKNKVQHLKQQINDFLERLEKQKKAGILGKIFKALGIIGVILAALIACVVPTPVTIAMVVITLVMFIEPMVAGEDSVIQKGMSELMQALTDVFGQAGGIAMAVAIFAAVAVASTALAARAVSSMGAAAANASTRIGKMIEKLPDFLRNLCTMDLTPKQVAALMHFLEAVEASLSMARGGVQIPMGILNLEVAKLLHAFEVDGAMADFITNMMSVIENDVQSLTDQILMLINMMLETMGPRD
ncbi:MAG TPA: hypothetical protein VFV39_01880 [Limnobacter sp.]|nr:hypothetical protein [Limnobacter sp.]